MMPDIREVKPNAELTTLKSRLLWDMNFRDDFCRLDEEQQAVIAFIIAEVDECVDLSCRSIRYKHDGYSVGDANEKAEEMADDECRYFSGSNLAEYFDWDRYIEDRLAVDEFRFNGNYVDIICEV